MDAPAVEELAPPAPDVGGIAMNHEEQCKLHLGSIWLDAHRSYFATQNSSEPQLFAASDRGRMKRY
jgi:hypothetical protein